MEDKLIDKLLKAELTHKPEILIIGKRSSEENLKQLKLKGLKYMLVSLTGTEIDDETFFFALETVNPKKLPFNAERSGTESM